VLRNILRPFAVLFYKIPLSCIFPVFLQRRLLLTSYESDRILSRMLRIIFGLEALYQRLNRFGLKPLSIQKVDIKHCNAQRPILCEMLPTTDASTIDFVEEYFSDSNGNPNWLIENSMHCSMYNSFIKHGKIGDIQELDYWKWQSYLDRAGINERPPVWIKAKIKKSINVLNSIRKNGFQECDMRKLPWLVAQPICSTRYGIKHKIHGYEIYDGHHRISALSSLGVERVMAIIVVDNAENTPFGIPLGNITKGNGNE